MSESKILVPVRLDALVVGKTTPKDKWKDFALDYRQMNTLMGTKLETSDLKALKDGLYESGVHLHWALPHALTNGIYIRDRQDVDKGKMVFPAVPNRWLVIRTQLIANKPVTKKWILESDYIGADGSAPWTIQKADGSFPATRIGIGRAVELKDWGTESPRAVTPLTAVAPGNEAFAAIYSSCRSVFGFYDDMSGYKEGQPCSYLVAGWYSEPGIDPLLSAPTEIRDNIRNRWTIKDQSGNDQFPDSINSIICHGFIHSVSWDKNTSYPLPCRDTAVNTGIGYTAIEAKTTQISKQTGAAEKLLSAFFYDALKDIQGAAEIEAQVGGRAFSDIDGGTLWDIQRTEDEATDKTKEEIQKPGFPDPAVEPALPALFKALNEEQRKLDRLLRVKESLQVTFRALSDKIIVAEKEKMTDKATQLETKRKTIKDDIDRITTDINTAAINIHGNGTIPGYIKQIRDLDSFKAGTRTKPEFELISRKMPRFWKPNDPVVVLSGPGVTESVKYKNPGNAEKLLCRLAADITSHLLLKDGARTEGAIDAPDMDVAITAKGSLTATNIDIISKLLKEALLLDPVWAAEWAFKYYGGDRNNENAKQMGKNLRLHLDVNEKGAATNNPAVKCYSGKAIKETIQDRKKLLLFLEEQGIQKWKHPWTPVYMIWYVNWLPSYKTTGNQKIYEKDKWVWKDKKYNYNGPVPGTAAPVEYFGKAILTDAVTGILKTRLEDTVTDHNISQALSFSNELIMRMQSVQLPLLKLDRVNKILTKDTTYDSYLTNTAYFFPHLDTEPAAAPNFFPIRAGHMRLTRLWITDAFGQVQKVIEYEDGVPKSTGAIYIASDMAETTNKELVRLSPRIIQPARLSFRWIKANATVPEETTADPSTTPVCGWLLSDSLNRSLNIYDAAGVSCGSVKTVDMAGKKGGISLEWAPPPGAATNTTPAASIRNSYLLNFVNSLLGQSNEDNSVVLKLLFKLCSKRAMFLDTAVTQQASGVAGIVGQPIALVRASLKLELQGLPVHPQGWDDSLTPGTKIDPPGLQGLEFPISLGDTRSGKDGLVGYFTDKTGFSKMHLAYGSDTKTGDNKYFSGDDVKLTFKTDTDPVGITMLIDPRGGVQADCGILPPKCIDLPPNVTGRALTDLEIHLLVAPFLGAADKPYIPVSMEQDRNWKLLQEMKPGDWKRTDVGDQNPMLANGFNTQKIQEGYLVLKPVVRKN